MSKFILKYHFFTDFFGWQFDTFCVASTHFLVKNTRRDANKSFFNQCLSMVGGIDGYTAPHQTYKYLLKAKVQNDHTHTTKPNPNKTTKQPTTTAYYQ